MTAHTLRETEYQAYLALRHRMLVEEPSAYWSSPSDDIAQGLDEFRALMAQPFNEIVVLEVGGELVATSGIVRNQKEKGRHRALIWGVYCVPEHRGNGYGRDAVRASIDLARTWEGVELVALSVSASGAAALHVYQSLGFERWGTEPDVLRVGGAPHDEHHLVLRL